MKLIGFVASAVGLALGLSGCATVTRGTSTQFSVASTPPGAAVKTSTGFSCAATPCSFKVPRKDSFDVTVSKAGFSTQTAHVRSAVAGNGAVGFAGNVLAGGLIGMAVDGTDGAMNDLTPNPLTVTLDAETIAQAKPAEPAAAQLASKP